MNQLLSPILLCGIGLYLLGAGLTAIATNRPQQPGELAPVSMIGLGLWLTVMFGGLLTALALRGFGH